jgi:hypothetical protein
MPAAGNHQRRSRYREYATFVLQDRWGSPRGEYYDRRIPRIDEAAEPALREQVGKDHHYRKTLDARRRRKK